MPCSLCLRWDDWAFKKSGSAPKMPPKTHTCCFYTCSSVYIKFVQLSPLTLPDERPIILMVVYAVQRSLPKAESLRGLELELLELSDISSSSSNSEKTSMYKKKSRNELFYPNMTNKLKVVMFYLLVLDTFFQVFQSTVIV